MTAGPAPTGPSVDEIPVAHTPPGGYFATPITVVASYEDDVHVLRPVALPIEVTRRRDCDQTVWTHLTFTARLDRIDAAADS